jgi:hypothetical protein
MPAPVNGGEPRWIRDAVVAWWDEIRHFFSTAAGFVRSPRRFGSAWADGEGRAMNPLAFLVSSWPILLPIDYGLQRVLRWDVRPEQPLIVELSRAIRPYLFLIPVSILLTAVFRLTGSRRRLTTTLGLLLYWMVFAVLAWIVGLLGCLVTGAGSWLATTSMYLTLPLAALALAGAHRLPWGWCLIVSYPSCVVSFKLIDAVFHWLRAVFRWG